MATLKLPRATHSRFAPALDRRLCNFEHEACSRSARHCGTRCSFTRGAKLKLSTRRELKDLDAPRLVDQRNRYHGTHRHLAPIAMRRWAALWRLVGHRRPTDRRNNPLRSKTFRKRGCRRPLHLDGDGGAAPAVGAASAGNAGARAGISVDNCESERYYTE
jgi:hypothetical protein